MAKSLQAELKQLIVDGTGPDLSRVRHLAARLRRTLSPPARKPTAPGRMRSDSAALIATDRRR